VSDNQSCFLLSIRLDGGMPGVDVLGQGGLSTGTRALAIPLRVKVVAW
jgi:hypothetical protein